jgi:hypothetical protein
VDQDTASKVVPKARAAVANTASLKAESISGLVSLDAQGIGPEPFCVRTAGQPVIHLTGRRQLGLEKAGWLGSRFTLTDSTDGRNLAEADRSGLFTIAWDMQLSNGPARLVSAGWFNTGYRVVQGGRVSADINRVGLCNGGWALTDDGSLQEADLLFIGLIYHTILRRNAAAAQHS